MKKIIYLIFLLFTYANLFSQSSDDNLIASKYNVLPVPDIFSTYINDTIYEKLNERTFNISKHLKSSSDFAWTVYSDRKNNVTYVDARKKDDEEYKKLDFMQAYRVKDVKGNMLHLVRPTSKKKFDNLEKYIVKNHPYSMPAIVSFPWDDSHKPFKDWVNNND